MLHKDNMRPLLRVSWPLCTRSLEAAAVEGTLGDAEERMIRDALARALEQGELHADVRPVRLARFLTTAIYGVGLLTRLPDSGGRIADAVAVLLESLDDAEPDA